MSQEAIRVEPPTQRGETRAGATTTHDHGRPTGSRSIPGLPVPSELLVLALIALAVLIAAAVTDDFDAAAAWTLVTVLGVAYILSRGFAKREHRGDHRSIG